VHCIGQLTSSQSTLPDHQYSILNMWHFQAAVFARFGLQPFQCKHSLAFGLDFKSPIEKSLFFGLIRFFRNNTFLSMSLIAYRSMFFSFFPVILQAFCVYSYAIHWFSVVRHSLTRLWPAGHILLLGKMKRRRFQFNDTIREENEVGGLLQDYILGFDVLRDSKDRELLVNSTGTSVFYCDNE
jgi:hypothetical protein